MPAWFSTPRSFVPVVVGKLGAAVHGDLRRPGRHQHRARQHDHGGQREDEAGQKQDAEPDLAHCAPIPAKAVKPSDIRPVIRKAPPSPCSPAGMSL